MNTTSGYWDLERCSWVENDPTTRMPPLRHAEHAHDRDIAGSPVELPGQRSEASAASAGADEPAGS